MTSGYDSFGSKKALRWIRELADAERLTIFVGAGSSVESGLPSWTALVQRLLDRAAEVGGLDEDERRHFVEWTLAREDVTGAGEIARQILKRRFRSRLRSSLYQDVASAAPAETARAVGQIALDRLSTVCELVTTNYDTLLEDAVREAVPDDRQVVALADNRSVAGDVVAVRHLHGVLAPGAKTAGPLVLSDRDYHLMQDPASWQESFVKNQLENNTCLFVGTSLTDPNLLRYLHRAARKPQSRHAAVFLRQQDSSLYDASPPEVIELREWSQERKWQEAGVTPLVLDYFSQSAQFLWEIVAATRQGARYQALPQRLRAWWRSLGASMLTVEPSAFRRNQDELHRIVRGALDRTLALISQSGRRRGSGEVLGLTLWVFDPDRGGLVNWASADRVWRDPMTITPVPIEWSSDFVAMHAYCSGSLVSESTERYAASRWNHVVAFPVYVHAETGRLPVGAMTLASSRTAEDSLLTRALDTVRSQAIPELATLTAELLAPLPAR